MSSPTSELPPALHEVWRASSLGACASACVPSGFATLDAELLGGGWPTRGLSEILSPQYGVLEWRLLAPALGALMSLAGHRRQQVWQASALRPLPKLLHGSMAAEDDLELPAAAEDEEVLWDYASLGLTLRSHPLAILRERLAQRGLKNAAELADCESDRVAHACGIVTGRQMSQTAKGTVFVTLEAETGNVQVIVWPSVYAEHRTVILRSRMLAVHRMWQRGDGGVKRLVAHRFENLTPLLGRLTMESRDF